MRNHDNRFFLEEGKTDKNLVFVGLMLPSIKTKFYYRDILKAHNNHILHPVSNAELQGEYVENMKFLPNALATKNPWIIQL